MKKWIRSVSQAAVLGMALGTYTQTAYADSGTPSRVSGEVKPPATLIELDEARDVLEALYLRLHTVNIQNHISEMKRDGVTTREYVAAFDLQGALVYDHELAGLGLRPENLRAGRNVGHQILPYEVQVGTDGRIYIKASAFALRNMTSAVLHCEEYGKHHYTYCEEEFQYGIDENDADGFHYLGDRDADGELVESHYKYNYRPNSLFGRVNNVDILVVEYDKDVASQLTSINLGVIDVDLNISLFGTVDGNFFVALTAGGSVGMEVISLNDSVSDSDESVGQAGGLRFMGEYGLYAHYAHGAWRINAGVNFIHKHLGGLPGGDGSLGRYQHIARPYLETSLQLQSAEDGLPIRAGLRVDGNVTIKDRIEFENIPKDALQKGSQSLLNGSFFISW